jgi:RNA polymerase sigma-70 factor (ECF subfamily)
MTESVSDHDLIRLIASGDRAAFRQVYARHSLRVHRFLMRQAGDHAAAEDLTNEVFMEVWRTAARFEGRSSVSTWMLSIAHHKAVDARRRRRESVLDDDAAEAQPDGADTPEEAALKSDKGAIIRRCLERLSPEHREIVDLVYYHEKSVKEASEITGVPENTVKTRMFYARKRLAELLKDAGLDSTWP